MITVFKDAAQLYPASASRPIVCSLSEQGGVRNIPFWLQLDGEYPADSIIKAYVLGGSLQLATQVFSVRPLLDGSEIPFAGLQDRLSVNGLLEVTGLPGVEGEYDWTLYVAVFEVEGEPVDTVEVPCKFVRRNQGLSARIRLLPEDRKLKPTLPGFLFGQYRWRDEDEVNAHTLVPTRWDQDVDRIGREKFIAGIGDDDDLELQRLEKHRYSVYPRVKHGHYWTGVDRYYCPSDDSKLEIFRVDGPDQVITLNQSPESQLPVYVGAFRQDDHGYYDAEFRYRYMANGFDPSIEGLQFTLSRRDKRIVLNTEVTKRQAFVGFAPPADRAMIELPVYPVWAINNIYIETPDNPCTIEREELTDGYVELTFPSDSAGRKIYIEYEPAIAVLYEAQGVEQTRLLDIDLNPGFAGIARGHLYVMHRKQKAKQITLFADKPRILIPPTDASVVGLVAFGPVYYEQDYALLMARVTGNTEQELIPNVRLRVIPGEEFQGLLNYLNPLEQDVDIISGGDGTASLIYTPVKGYGFYLDPETSVQDDVITLPAPVPLSQLWNVDEGWLITTYMVRDDHPFLGKKDANLAFGEIGFETWNEPGSVLYKTNGLRTMWRNGLLDPEAEFPNAPVRPIQVFDADDVAAILGDGSIDPDFDGNVVRIQYAAPLPDESAAGLDNVSAYFISFIGRVRLQVQDVETGLISNTILLQLEAPPEIQDAPDVSGYLYLNTAEEIKQGRLNANRLGGAPVPQFAFNAPRY